jgi:hypothetical protein
MASRSFCVAGSSASRFLVRALRQSRVAAHHQALVRIAFAGDLDQAASVEQRDLPRPLFFHELGDSG